jgi:hypothetical protein
VGYSSLTFQDALFVCKSSYLSKNLPEVAPLRSHIFQITHFFGLGPHFFLGMENHRGLYFDSKLPLAAVLEVLYIAVVFKRSNLAENIGSSHQK